jgi:hypothetical protein
VAAGRVGDIAALLQEEAFFSRCAARYRAAGFGTPDAAEERSWRNSWPPLFTALMRAGLEDLQVYLEYGTPGGGRRLDALLIGATPDEAPGRVPGEAPGGVLGLVVVELKQWQTCRILDADRVMRSDGLVTAHPVHQVAAYRSFFQHWRPQDAPVLDVRGVVVLHNATADEGAALAAGAGGNAGILVLTGKELSGPADVLAGLLQCGDLAAADAGQVAAFEDIRWTPAMYHRRSSEPPVHVPLHDSNQATKCHPASATVPSPWPATSRNSAPWPTTTDTLRCHEADRSHPRNCR